MQFNKERLIELRKYVIEHEEQFNYDIYLAVTDTTVRHNPDEAYTNATERNWCGTAGCLAGMTVVLYASKEEFSNSCWAIEELAATKLGFPTFEYDHYVRGNTRLMKFLFFPHTESSITKWLAYEYEELIELRSINHPLHKEYEAAFFQEAIARLDWVIADKNIDEYQPSDSPFMRFAVRRSTSTH